MNCLIKRVLMICLLASGMLAVPLSAFAGGGEAEEPMAEEAMPEEAMAEEAMLEEAMAEEPMVGEAMIKDTDVSIYGRFWPRITYKDVDGGTHQPTSPMRFPGSG